MDGDREVEAEINGWVREKDRRGEELKKGWKKGGLRKLTGKMRMSKKDGEGEKEGRGGKR